jgi:ribosomal protein L16/L10AE
VLPSTCEFSEYPHKPNPCIFPVLQAGSRVQGKGMGGVRILAARIEIGFGVTELPIGGLLAG